MAVLASVQDRVEVWNKGVKMPEVEEDETGQFYLPNGCTFQMIAHSKRLHFPMVSHSKWLRAYVPMVDRPMFLFYFFNKRFV